MGLTEVSIFLVGAGLVAALGLFFLYQQSSWKAETSGVILQSEMEQIARPLSARTADRPQPFEYLVHLRYQYEVDGVSYEGSQIIHNPLLHFFSDRSTSFIDERAAKQVLEKYPLEKQVSVYFNPKKPQESALEQLGPGQVIFLCGLVFIVLSLMGAMLYFVVPMMRS